MNSKLMCKISGLKGCAQLAAPAHESLFLHKCCSETSSYKNKNVIGEEKKTTFGSNEEPEQPNK